MTGVITSLPPLVEQPPGNNSNNPAGLPGVTYTAAIPNLPQTWTGLQTYTLGSMQFAGSTSGNTFLNATAIASGTLTLPAATDTLVARNTTDTLTNKTLTNPVINGATITGSSIAIHSSGTGNFDLSLINSENLTAGRSLTLTVNDASRTLNMGGNITTAGAFTSSGAFASTFTMTGTTTVTFPTTGTLATLAGSETFTNKTLTAPAITTPTGIVKGDVGLGNVANVDTTNAANISSGTLPAGRLPNPSATTLGGVQSIAASANNWIASISTAGVPSLSQPAFSNISGTVAATQLPNPSATTLGGVQSLAAVASRWINTISTSGVPSATQPAFTDISGQATLAQLPTIGANTVLGSIAGGTPIALSTAQHTSLVNTFTTSLSGAVPSPGALASKFLRDDGTWQAVAGAGTVTSVGSGTGLTGGPITASGTLAIDTAVVPRLGVANTFTAVQTFPAGAVGAPSIVGPSSTNTGMWFPAANVAAISGNGGEVLRWSNGGLGRASAFQAVWTMAANALCFQGGGTAGSVGCMDFSNSALTQCGAINMDQGAHTTNFLTSSDERGKPFRTLLSADTARAVVDGLEIYDYDDPRNLIQGVGPLAQQAYYVLPRMVAEGDSEQILNLDSPTCQMWLTDLSKAVPYLIANLQECNRQIAALESQVAQLTK